MINKNLSKKMIKYLPSCELNFSIFNLFEVQLIEIWVSLTIVVKISIIHIENLKELLDINIFENLCNRFLKTFDRMNFSD
jgi:hypothetical protein